MTMFKNIFFKSVLVFRYIVSAHIADTITVSITVRLIDTVVAAGALGVVRDCIAHQIAKSVLVHGSVTGVVTDILLQDVTG